MSAAPRVMHQVSNLAVIRPASYGISGAKKGYLLYWENGKGTSQTLDALSWTIYPTVEAAHTAARAKNPAALVAVEFEHEFVVVPARLGDWHDPEEALS